MFFSWNNKDDGIVELKNDNENKSIVGRGYCFKYDNKIIVFDNRYGWYNIIVNGNQYSFYNINNKDNVHWC